MFTKYRLYTLVFFLMTTVSSFADNSNGSEFENETQGPGEPGPPAPIDENLYWLLLLGLFFAYKFFMRYQKSVVNSK
jgi:hypothetical protein